jgi:hypothetical protein
MACILCGPPSPFQVNNGCLPHTAPPCTNSAYYPANMCSGETVLLHITLNRMAKAIDQKDGAYTKWPAACRCTKHVAHAHGI